MHRILKYSWIIISTSNFPRDNAIIMVIFAIILLLESLHSCWSHPIHSHKNLWIFLTNRVSHPFEAISSFIELSLWCSFECFWNKYIILIITSILHTLCQGSAQRVYGKFWFSMGVKFWKFEETLRDDWLLHLTLGTTTEQEWGFYYMRGLGFRMMELFFWPS